MSYGENQAMADFTPPIICGCEIVQNRIVFCAVHKQAEKLLVVCEYLRNIIIDGKLSETKDKFFVKEIVLPYLKSAIDAATKKGQGA